MTCWTASKLSFSLPLWTGRVRAYGCSQRRVWTMLTYRMIRTGYVSSSGDTCIIKYHRAMPCERGHRGCISCLNQSFRKLPAHAGISSRENAGYYYRNHSPLRFGRYIGHQHSPVQKQTRQVKSFNNQVRRDNILRHPRNRGIGAFELGYTYEDI